METFLEMAERHRDMDMLEQGSFEWLGKACSVGCFNHDLGQKPGDFEALAAHTGYPDWAHRFQEAVFEGLPSEKANDWHVNFAKRAADVTDWVDEHHRVIIGILRIALPYDKSSPSVVRAVINLHKRGTGVTEEEWAAARAEAVAAAASAAAAAARAAAEAAASAAAAAARAAAEAAAAAAAAEDDAEDDAWDDAWGAVAAARAAAWAAAWAAAAAAAAEDDAEDDAWVSMSESFVEAA